MYQISPQEQQRLHNELLVVLGSPPSNVLKDKNYLLQDPREVERSRKSLKPLESQATAQSEKSGFDSIFGEGKNRARFGEITGEASRGLLSKVYALLAFSVATTVGGGVLGYRLDPGWFWLFAPLSLVLVLAISKLRECEGWNVALLYSFSVVEGLMLGPVIAAYVGAGMLSVVVEAGVAIVVVTAAMSAIGLGVKRDLSVWGAFLFSALIGLISIMLVSLFLANSFVSIVASSAGVGLFSLFLVYDVNRIRNTPDTMANAVVICLDLYLDILNLFLQLLRLLAELSNDD
jgi:FtsH-binding integral membrane protein